MDTSGRKLGNICSMMVPNALNCPGNSSDFRVTIALLRADDFTAGAVTTGVDTTPGAQRAILCEFTGLVCGLWYL
jgi:hypothetical protein